MANNTPNSLHKLLPVELRRQVEEALRNQPPGLATYRQVYEEFELEKAGISYSALTRFGQDLRDQAKEAVRDRLMALKEMRAALVGDVDLDEPTADLLYAELFGHIAAAERDPKTMRSLAGALRDVVSANVARQTEKRNAEVWAGKRRQIEQAIANAEAGKGADPGKALDRAIADLRAIYGLDTGEESTEKLEERSEQ